ncbi:MarR family winged helix-turn-helix transcriptional regulator [Shewanella sp. MBTL60-007]|uniref:MarR family winged helix-turn-helix transcriptional regulator n=1 Tax=Shewanella sp. MBTL60-007 TaxID=2815911 RepID=UPI001BC7E235|nr:MarR family transcriptional regulator [Shewanella sp. MBTL60-007]GIU30910.1 hypothetical protein TUM3792_42150 [Shewanella sp. MBTL60-007]
MNATQRLMTLLQQYRQRIRADIDADDSQLNAMHVECLRIISHQQPCGANLIANMLDRDKSQISLLIKDMLAKGWLVRQDNPTDKRSKLLSLTSEGLQIVTKVSRADSELNELLLQGLTTQELDSFNLVLDKMIVNLSR